MRAGQSSIYDTIIIGAGWAGAAAARELSAKGRKVLILEARDRVGGRAKTWSKDGINVDVGCSWIHGYKEGNPARAIAKDLGVVAHLPKPAEGVIYGPDGPLSSSTADALRASLSAAQAAFKTPHPSPAPSKSLASALFAQDSPLFTTDSKPDSSADTSNTSPANPTLAPQSGSNPQVDQELVKSFARSLEVPLGVKLEQVSLNWSGWEGATSFGGSDAAPDGGYEALVGKVFAEAEKNGAEVSVSTTVKGIKESEGTVTVDSDKGSFEASTVICTIPLGVLKTLPDTFFAPALPGQFQEAIEGTHVGVLEKLLLNYQTAWWPNHETVGSYTFLPTGPTPTESSSLEEIFAGSTLTAANFACPSLPGPNPTLLTYLSETPARLLLQHPTEKVAIAYHEYLVKRFGASDAPKPSNYNLTDWLTDPLSRGATTTPSIVSENGERSPMDFKELSRPVWGGKLGFAGEHTEMEHRGSVAGAVVSGQREAARIIRYFDSQSA